MKRLFCLLCAAALVLTVGAVPALGEAGDRSAELAQILMNDATVQEVWLPRLGDGFALTGVAVQNDGSYVFSVEKNFIGDRCGYVSRAALVSAENDSADCSPYQTLTKQHGAADPLSLQSPVAVDPNEQPPFVTSAEDNKTTTYSYGGWVKGDFEGQPVLFTAWETYTRNGGDIYSGSLYELLIRVSDNYLLSIQIVPTGDGLVDLFGSFEQTPGRLLETVGFSLDRTTGGDANLDGAVTARDALALLKHTVGKTALTDPLAFALCDWDGNDALDAPDALRTLRRAVE